jgi:hypothetical protein
MVSNVVRAPAGAAARCGVLARVAIALLAAATPIAHAAFTNPGFEGGLSPPWIIQYYTVTDLVHYPPQTLSDLSLVAAPSGSASAIIGSNQPDGMLGLAASLRYPLLGSSSAILNYDPSTAATKSAVLMTQTMTIGAADVDPTDGRIRVRFAIAPVLQDPGHIATQQPYVFVELVNVTQGNVPLWHKFYASGVADVPWQAVTVGANTFKYLQWEAIDISPGSPALNMNDQVQLRIVAARCSPGSHDAHVYVDSSPNAAGGGAWIRATAPRYANPSTGGTITYAYAYGNASSTTSAVNVVVNINTPASMTFQSMTPPVGATCVTPPVGTSGSITCTFTNPVPPGASGTFSMTFAGVTASTPSPIWHSDYSISSTASQKVYGVPVYSDLAATQSISFPNPGTHAFDPATPIPLLATASSGLAVTYTSLTPGVCNVSGSSVGMLAAANCNIAANQAGSDAYQAAAQVTRSFDITPGSQTIAFADPGSQTYAPAATFAISATATSNLPVVFSASTPTVCSLAGNTVTILSGGVCTLAADQSGNLDWMPASTVSHDITINPANQSIDFPDPGMQYLRRVTFELGATASSGLPVTYASVTTNICTVSGSTVTMLTAGYCSISATQSGDGNYLAAPDVAHSFDVVDDRIFANGFD